MNMLYNGKKQPWKKSSISANMSHKSSHWYLQNSNKYAFLIIIRNSGMYLYIVACLHRNDTEAIHVFIYKPWGLWCFRNPFWLPCLYKLHMFKWYFDYDRYSCRPVGKLILWCVVYLNDKYIHWRIGEKLWLQAFEFHFAYHRLRYISWFHKRGHS